MRRAEEPVLLAQGPGAGSCKPGEDVRQLGTGILPRFRETLSGWVTAYGVDLFKIKMRNTKPYFSLENFRKT